MQDIITKVKAVIARASEKIKSIRKGAEEETKELVHEAQTEEVFVAEIAKRTMRERVRPICQRVKASFEKLSPKERIVLIFVVGLIIGFGIKTAANGRFVIGYRDYTAKNDKAYDLIQLQKEVAKRGSGSAFSGTPTGGGSCSQ